MEKNEAEEILRQHFVERSPEDSRTIEQIAEQIQRTGSPRPDTCQAVGTVAVTDARKLLASEL
ncbi:MAG: hypothetical protein ACREGF_06715 [Candidatus Saccharimonadales bacterium]